MEEVEIKRDIRAGKRAADSTDAMDSILRICELEGNNSTETG